MVETAETRKFFRKERVLYDTKLLLRQYKLDDWKFSFNNRNDTLGLTDYDIKEISISKFLFDKSNVDDATILDIIYHEIAHVLAGPEAEHGQGWLNKANEVGATPTHIGHVCLSEFIDVATND